MASVDDQAEFETWVREELARSPLAGQGFSTLLDRAATILCRIRSRLADPSLGRGKAIWQRLMKNGRMLKEVNEVLPIAARVLQWIDEVRQTAIGPITVLDLCSGVGYLSLLLSELLETSGKDVIARLVLVDDAWPRADHVGPPKAHHINPEHLHIQGVWSHELFCRRCDFKSSYGHRELAQHVLARAPGPVAVLGVHLCSILSIRAVQLYNDHPRCCFFALKPCCLPDSILARRAYAWQIGGHEIDAKDVCGSGNNRYLRGKWRGSSPKEQEKAAFQRWCEHLIAGVDTRLGGTKELVNYQLVAGVNEMAVDTFALGSSLDGSIGKDETDIVVDDVDDEGEGQSEDEIDISPPKSGQDKNLNEISVAMSAASGAEACTASTIKSPPSGIESKTTGADHSRHRYQTAFLFAQRSYSAEEGVVSKIGGGPEEQFWRI